MFRRPALENHRAAVGAAGAPLDLDPRWIAPTYWLLVGIAVVAVGLLGLGRAYEMANGPAVVQAEGRLRVAAVNDGTVATVEVRPGQRVQAGDALVTFHFTGEQAELHRIEREIEAHLVALLREPESPAHREALAGLNAQRELAESRVGERTLRAPASGPIRDLRVRPGQRIGAGEMVLAIGTEAATVVTAFLPGRVRPFLQVGAELRLLLEGFADAPAHLVIESIGDEVVGPAEAQRFIGPEIGDSLHIEQPVVIVRARVCRVDLAQGAESLRLFVGMSGTVEARVRKERLLFLLFPTLKSLRGFHV